MYLLPTWGPNRVEGKKRQHRADWLVGWWDYFGAPHSPGRDRRRLVVWLDNFGDPQSGLREELVGII